MIKSKGGSNKSEMKVKVNNLESLLRNANHLKNQNSTYSAKTASKEITIQPTKADKK